MYKERFHEQKRSKLMLRVDGSFQIFDRINDNTYKVDIPSEYGVNATFNTFFISFYLMGDDS
jgi:hypothetical protein